MTESRSVVVRLTAETAQYIAQMQKSGKVGADAMTQVEKSTTKAGGAMDSLAGKAGKMAAITGGLLLATGKAAMDWESAWTGVTKTVDGSASEMAQLESELRGLAKTLPATHAEIAGVAEAAGQLGVAREDITAFTKTMIDLSETTNLTADQAATQIAQISNVMGTAGADVDNFGSALVALGNDGASTEAEILSMTQRIAGAGAQIGLTETDILGISNAAASMGINAEAGGSAISRVFTELAKATKQGGAGLDAFAKVAGVSADSFVQAFEDDPARAFASFTQGLDRINKSGGDVFTVLDDLGLADVRVSQALLSMAASGDLLTDSLDLGAHAWTENTALADESAKRYATTAAQVQIAWNQIKDAAIEAGAVLLPIIAEGAEAVGTMADAFGELPGPVKQGVTALLGIATVVGGATWFGAKVIGSIRSTRAELALLGAQAPRTAGALSSVSAAAGRITKLRTGALLAGMAVASTGAADSIGLSNSASLALMGTFVGGPWGAAIGGAIGLTMDLAGSNEDLADAINQANKASSEGDLLDALSRLREERDSIASIDGVGDYFSSVAGVFTGSTLKAFDEANAAIKATEDRLFAVDAAATGSDLERWALQGMGATAEQAEIASASIEDLSAAMEDLNAQLSGRASWRDYEAAIDAVADSLKENGKTLDITTAKGRANQDALDGVAATSIKVAESLNGMNRVRFLNRARQDFIAAAMDLGRTRQQARGLADELGLVDRKRVNPKVDLEDGAAKKKIGDVWANLDRLGKKKADPKVSVDSGNSIPELAAIHAGLNRIYDKTVTVRINTVRTGNTQRGAALVPNAEGNIYPSMRFANGGSLDIANNHPPMMSGGIQRVWGEEETQGETYIPHANDHRRPRAKSLLEQTASMFGGDVRWYANGGELRSRTFTRRTQAGTGSTAPTAMTVTGTLQTPWGPATIEGIARDVAREEIANDDKWEGGLDR